MTHKRVFYDGPLADSGEILVTGSAAHHLATVMRVKRGEQVEVRDGRGSAWLGEVVGLGGREVVIRWLVPQSLDNESPLLLTLALGYARSDRMDLVVRQATELGVHRLVFFRAARSQYALGHRQLSEKTLRWLRIATEALLQCGRIRLPDIEAMPDVRAIIARLSDWELTGDDALRLLAWEEERDQGLVEIWRQVPDCCKAMVVVGPEGGLTAEEVDQFNHAGFRSVHLGPRTLRLETAATALIANTQLLWGDLTNRSDHPR